MIMIVDKYCADEKIQGKFVNTIFTEIWERSRYNSTFALEEQTGQNKKMLLLPVNAIIYHIYLIIGLKSRNNNKGRQKI
jgi:hypothetical protein